MIRATRIVIGPNPTEEKEANPDIDQTAKIAVAQETAIETKNASVSGTEKETATRTATGIGTAIGIEIVIEIMVVSEIVRGIPIERGTTTDQNVEIRVYAPIGTAPKEVDLGPGLNG